MSQQLPPNRPRSAPPSANPAGMSARGAVDLAALAQAREQERQAQERAAARAADPQAFAAAQDAIFDATVAGFQQQVVDRSFEVPVVVELWAAGDAASAQLSPVLENLAVEFAGAWVLARVNVQEQPEIAQAFQIQAVPTVVALLKGQPVPLMQSPMPEAQIRQILSELVAVAAENGVSAKTSGSDEASADEAEAGAEESTEDPGFDRAYEAFEAGDWDGVEAAYRDILTRSPEDPDAVAGLTRVALMRRTAGHDQAAAITAADADPANVSAAILAADFALQDGDARGAFARLIAAIKATTGDDRTAAREHLVSLFELVGQQDPDVASARTALANALF